MYLSELKPEAKPLFLDMSIHLAERDADFCLEEREMIRLMCYEMNIEVRYTAENDVETVLRQLKTLSSFREKRIILLELTGIMMADGKITDCETAIVKELADAFEVEHLELETIIGCITELHGIYTQFGSFLSGK